MYRHDVFMPIQSNASGDDTGALGRIQFSKNVIGARQSLRRGIADLYDLDPHGIEVCNQYFKTRRRPKLSVLCRRRVHDDCFGRIKFTGPTRAFYAFVQARPSGLVQHHT